jgi:GNAT superfamily N-acetyltransferase
MEIEFSKSKEDIQQLNRLIDEYNELQAGKVEYDDFAFVLKAESGEISGGICGTTFFELIYIGIFVVIQDYRGQGFGRMLMDKAIALARERKCRMAYLETMSFQNRGFYLKYGFETAGELKNFPIDGSSKYTMFMKLS